MKKILGFLILIIPLLGIGQSSKAPPRDETAKDSSLNLFVLELKKIIESKDGKRLLKIVHPKIKVGFDDGVGIDDFISVWIPERKESELWYIMKKIVELGGVFIKNDSDPFYRFVFPYVNQIELKNPDDYFNVLVVTGKNVNVRDKPNLKSKILGKLTYDVVRYDYEKSFPKLTHNPIPHVSYYGPKEWYYIETGDKKLSGYVYYSFVWSPIDYRMYLTKENGQWMISCLVSGD
jgi:hypothetical protein